MDLDLEYEYVKMCRKKKKTLVAYKDKMKKTTKTSLDHNFQLGAQI
jgi:hypothetical protein